MSRAILARRAGVSLPTVNRILSGKQSGATLGNVHAIAAALGVEVRIGSHPKIAETIGVDEFRKQQATAKARRLARMVQGTMALEAQAVDQKTLKGLMEGNVHRLLAGSNRRLWDE